MKPSNRATSACSTNRDARPRSAFKLTRCEQNQLINDTADILATMVKSRRTTQEPTLFNPQVKSRDSINKKPFRLNLVCANVSFTEYKSISTSTGVNILIRKKEKVSLNFSDPSTDLRILSITQIPTTEKPTVDDIFTLVGIDHDKNFVHSIR